MKSFDRPLVFFILRTAHILLAILFGIFTIGITVFAAMAIIGVESAGDIPRYPRPEFWGLIGLVTAMIVVMSYVILGRNRTHRNLAYCTLAAVFVISLVMATFGLSQKNEEIKDPGLVWLLHSVILAGLVALTDWRARRELGLRDSS